MGVMGVLATRPGPVVAAFGVVRPAVTPAVLPRVGIPGGTAVDPTPPPPPPGPPIALTVTPGRVLATAAAVAAAAFSGFGSASTLFGIRS